MCIIKVYFKIKNYTECNNISTEGVHFPQFFFFGRTSSLLYAFNAMINESLVEPFPSTCVHVNYHTHAYKNYEAT